MFLFFQHGSHDGVAASGCENLKCGLIDEWCIKPDLSVMKRCVKRCEEVCEVCVRCACEEKSSSHRGVEKRKFSPHRGGGVEMPIFTRQKRTVREERASARAIARKVQRCRGRAWEECAEDGGSASAEVDRGRKRKEEERMGARFYTCQSLRWSSAPSASIHAVLSGVLPEASAHRCLKAGVLPCPASSCLVLPRPASGTDKAVTKVTVTRERHSRHNPNSIGGP